MEVDQEKERRCPRGLREVPSRQEVARKRNSLPYLEAEAFGRDSSMCKGRSKRTHEILEMTIVP